MFSATGQDEDFVNRPGGQDRGIGLWLLLLMVLGVIGGFLIWAALYEIEEVTRAQGRVVPSSQVQTVQSPEGGVIAAIEVAEGALVKAGDVLFQIDDTSVQASLGELEQRYNALTAESVRLRAEARRAPLDFPEGLSARLVEAETAIFETRRTQLDLELTVLADRLAQRRAELAELGAQRARSEAVAGPLRREVEISEGLFRSNAIPEVEILRLRSDLASVVGDIAVFAATEARLEAGIAEVETQIASARSSYGLAAQERLAVVLGDLSVVEKTLVAARDRVSRTGLKSPVDGVVNQILVNTVGGVVQPGMVLAEVVPVDDSLLVEARVSPRDVAFLRVGAPASVKITAYDYLRYGDLKAEVERIGADALVSEDGAPYFQVTLRTDEVGLTDEEGSRLPVSAGMVAEVDIQSGSKTVLGYLVQPVLRAQHEALRER